MAATSTLLYQSPLDGSSVAINFDGASLIANGLTLISGAQASGPLIFWYTVNGVTTSLQVNQGVSTTYSFSPPLHGIAGTDKHGGSNIQWDITAFGAGVGLTPPTPVIIVS